MFQKILLFITFFFFIQTSTFANQKVEDVFVDIDSNYKYLSELQLLYDKGIIQPNIHNKFKPYELLSREEFVGILMETNCVQCIKPDVSYQLIEEFNNTDVYYDVHNISDYFYCINSADNKGYIQGYQESTTCEDGKNKEGFRPFCPYNTIILEEALAIVMRAGNILSKQQASNFIKKINNGESYPDLSDDVTTKNQDDSIYDFYPYFYEADRFTITEYNNLGEKQEYSLLEKTGNKYFPKKNINREEFLKLAVFSIKNSNCIDSNNVEISGEIDIFNGEKCEIGSKNCDIENDFNTGDLIDLSGNLNTSCLLGFSEETSYKWIIHNLSQNTEIIQMGKYLDNYIFQESGKYKIDLFVTDLCNNSSKITKYISISGGNNDNFTAVINKVYTGDLNVDFSSIVEGNTGEYTYLWDFGDGNTSNEKNPSHGYNEIGEYDVTLTVTDKNGVEKQIPTTVNFYDNDFNVAIKKEKVVIGSTDFVQLYGVTNSNNQNLTYFWDLGDGTTSNEQNPLHNYTPGLYIVTLTVTDENGNSKTVTTQVIISDGDFAINTSVDTQEIESGLEAEFIPIIDGGIGPFTYQWDLGDGNSSNEESPIHTYDQPGIYTVELTVTDSNGNTQTTYTQVLVSDTSLDTQIITTPNNNSNGEFTFTPIVDGGVGPFTYQWDLGDGNSSNEEVPNHQYQENGTYTVTLMTTDANGLVSMSETTVVVIGNQETNFNIDVNGDPLNGPGPLTSNLSVATLGGTGPFSYTWDLGDGNTAGGKNITHTFTQPGTYEVKVDVVDSNGIIKSETLIIVVGPANNTTDTDKDGILDINDKCPSIKGKEENDGCPIFGETCNTDSDCNENSMCGLSSKGISTCIPVAVKNNCEYNGDSTVFGNVICNTCPCQNILDFNASLRNCDVVFPAITSPDGSEIYSKGNYYQIKK